MKALIGLCVLAIIVVALAFFNRNEKPQTADGWEIVDSCVTQKYAEFRMMGLARQGKSAGWDLMDNPCDSLHAYYLVSKDRK